MVGYSGGTGPGGARVWFTSRAGGGISIRRFLSNTLAVRALRSAEHRGAGLRLFISLALLAAWLAFGILAARQPGAQAQPGPIGIAVEAVTDFICIVQKGKTCEVEVGTARTTFARVSQTCLALFTVLTFVFGFWSQIMGAVAQMLRGFGKGHVIVVGDDVEAEALARDVARRGRRHRKAVVLIRDHASDADVEALGADGVALIAGPPSSAAVLRRAGVGGADKVVAIGSDDAQNVAVSAAAAAARREGGAQRQPGDVLMRVEDRALRQDLAGRQALGEVSFFSLPDIAARKALVSPAFFEHARLLGQDRLHIVAVGEHPHLFATAAKTFRLLWARDLKPPRVSLFTRDEKVTAQVWANLFPGAAGNAWAADISFHTLTDAVPSNAWERFKPALETATALVVAHDSPAANLRLAAALARDSIPGKNPLIYALEDSHGSLGVTLGSDPGVRVLPFGAPQEVATSEALLDQALDEAARVTHERYLETVILSGARDRYVEALQRAAGDRSLTDPGALEARVTEKRGQRALDRLRRKLSLALLRDPDHIPKNTTPAQAPWRALSETFVTRNRNAADHAIAKLWSLGWRPAFPGERGGAPKIMREEITDADCEIEHQRWMADLFMDGWKLGPRDDHTLTHPDLQTYRAFAPDKLQAAIEKDRDQWIKAGETGMIMYPRGFVRIARPTQGP